MEKEIEKTLYRAGVLRRYVGFNYFVDAVNLMIQNPEDSVLTCKEIYITIAQKHKTNPQTVERNLRTIRDVFMKNNGKAILQDMGYTLWRERPHVRELIEMFATYYKN